MLQIADNHNVNRGNPCVAMPGLCLYLLRLHASAGDLRLVMLAAAKGHETRVKPLKTRYCRLKFWEAGRASIRRRFATGRRDRASQKLGPIRPIRPVCRIEHPTPTSKGQSV